MTLHNRVDASVSEKKVTRMNSELLKSDALSGSGGYKIRIDEQDFTIHTPELTGRELLGKVNRSPSDFILTLVLQGEPDRLVDPDEVISLAMPGTEQFSLVSKQRHYSIHIDDTLYDTVNRTPTGRDLLEIVGKKSCSHFLVQILVDRDDEIIDADETVDLAIRGTERFAVVVRDTVTVTVDDKKVELPRGKVSVSEIKHRGNVAEGYVLVRDNHGQLSALGNDDSVDIHGCEIFISHVKEGGAS